MNVYYVVYSDQLLANLITKKHIKTKKHIQNKKTFDDKKVDDEIKTNKILLKRQPQISTITTEIQRTQYEFYLSALSTNMSASQIIKFNVRFGLKRRIKYGQNIPETDSKFSKDMNHVLLSYQNKIKQYMNICVDVETDKYFHWSALLDEGSVNGMGAITILTALGATSKPVLTKMDFIELCYRFIYGQYKLFRL